MFCFIVILGNLTYGNHRTRMERALFLNVLPKGAVARPEMQIYYFKFTIPMKYLNEQN